MLHSNQNSKPAFKFWVFQDYKKFRFERISSSQELTNLNSQGFGYDCTHKFGPTRVPGSQELKKLDLQGSYVRNNSKIKFIGQNHNNGDPYDCLPEIIKNKNV